MKNTKIINIITAMAITLMIVLSFSNLLGINAASLSVILGVFFFFVIKILSHRGFEGSGLDLKSLPINLKQRKIWLWIALPFILNLLQVVLSQLFLPEWLAYELNRAGGYLSEDGNLLILVVQFLVLALGEEIAWRAFFQKQMTKVMPLCPVLALSAVLFALGHFTSDNLILVAFNLIFIATNSVVFGIIFQKTKNAWVSGIAHFLGNILIYVVMILL